jgi:hypothetical protein
MRWVFALALLFWELTSSAEAGCHTAAWQSKWGVETTAYMQTDGAVCRTSVSRVWNTSEVKSVNIASAPRNGTASASGRSVTYRPRPGFKGDDSFVFAIVGRKAGGAQRATVRVSVAVR